MAFSIDVYTSEEKSVRIDERITNKSEAENKGLRYLEEGVWYEKPLEWRFYPAKSIHHIRILEKRTHKWTR